MSAITTHVLDVSRGRPAQGIPVVLERVNAPHATVLARAITDADGRVKTFTPSPSLTAGGIQAFYPRVVVEFDVRDASQHYHVPLLLSPFGYSTYRGS